MTPADASRIKDDSLAAAAVRGSTLATEGAWRGGLGVMLLECTDTLSGETDRFEEGDKGGELDSSRAEPADSCGM